MLRECSNRNMIQNIPQHYPEKILNSPYNCAAKVLFGARIRAGLLAFSITFAIVNVLPDPVT